MPRDATCPGGGGWLHNDGALQWYQCIYYVYWCPDAKEAGAGIQQVIDPVYHNRALLLGYTNADATGIYSLQGMETASIDNGRLHNTYPVGMMERIVFRTDIQTWPGTSAGGTDVNVWTWSMDNPPGSTGFAPSPDFEWDLMEVWAPYSIGAGTTDQATHNWTPDNHGSTIFVQGQGVVDASTYHTWDLLTTTDAASQIVNCGYLDGQLQSCQPLAGNYLEGQMGEYGTILQNGFKNRQMIAMWNGDYYGWFGAPGLCSYAGSGIGPQYCPQQTNHLWIKSIAVWTCADWQGADYPGNACPGPVITQ
jgi:hypothetical protein